jgi:hypothetical protein
MKIKDVAQRIDARLHSDNRSDISDVRRVYCADTMSDLIEHASPDTLLVTSLNNAQLIRVAELMDVPGICLTRGAEPTADLLKMARAAGTAILVSPCDAAETRRRVEECLAAVEAPRGAGARAP